MRSVMLTMSLASIPTPPTGPRVPGSWYVVGVPGALTTG